LLDIPDVRRNHTLLFFPLKIISGREIYSDSLFNPTTRRPREHHQGEARPKKFELHKFSL